MCSCNLKLYHNALGGIRMHGFQVAMNTQFSKFSIKIKALIFVCFLIYAAVIADTV